MSELLKYARARDDESFQWRIAAAMTLKAQAEALWELSPEQRKLTDWVLNNPMEWQERMVAFVATNPSIAASITLAGEGTDGGVVDTSGVPDSDIIFVVNESWDAVAKALFPVTVVGGGTTGSSSGGSAGTP